MNLDARAERYAQRESEFARRESYGSPYAEPKLVVTPPWELPPAQQKPREPFPYTGRWATCPRCGAGPPSELLTQYFPDMVEERPGEECDLYVHECKEEWQCP